MTLKISVEFGRDNLSEQLNRRYAGIVEIGIYQGFKAEPVPGQMKLKISRDGFEVSSAAVKFGEFTLFATDNEETEIDVVSSSITTTKLIVIDAKYQWGVTRPVEYKVIDEGERESHQLEMCRITIPANEIDSDNFIFDITSRENALRVIDLPPIIDAETQARGVGDQIKYERLRKSLKDLYGRAIFLNDAFKISAIPPAIEDNCETITGWSLSGGSGIVEVDGVEFIEGAASLKVSGQITGAELTRDVSAIPRNWSLKNGLNVAVKGDLATNISFFIEDSLFNRNKWNLVNQIAWTIYELKLGEPDINNNCDLTDICKFGIEGLDNGTIYWIDIIKTCVFNNFNIEAGESILEGIRLEKDATTYRNHNQDYNGDQTPVVDIAPPESGTRTDNVYLDIYVQGEFNTIAPIVQIKVSDQALNDYIDGDYQHFIFKIAELERTTSQQIITSMCTDLCYRQHPDNDGVIWDLNFKTILDFIYSTLISENRLVSGTYNSGIGQLENVQIKFVSDGVISLMDFTDTQVLISPIQQIWCANRVSGIISGVDLKDYFQIITADDFPILYTGYYKNTMAPFAKMIAPKNHNIQQNIRLNNPKINEDVALTVTASKLNAVGSDMLIQAKATKYDVTGFTVSASWTEMPNLTIAITTRIANSKILLLAALNNHYHSDYQTNLDFTRKVNAGAVVTNISGSTLGLSASATSTASDHNRSLLLLDTPNVAAGTVLTYGVCVHTPTLGISYNSLQANVGSVIVAIEVAP